MAFERAKQSLSDLEDRLRRAFGLAGDINAKLEPLLTPVLIAGDLREPGHSYNRGRSWAWIHDHLTNAGTGYVSLQFNADVLVESLYFYGAQASAFADAYILTPTEAPAVAMSRTAGAWRDRKLVSTDIPPIQDSGATYAARTGVDVAITNRVCTWNGSGAYANPTGDSGFRPVLMMLVQGSTLNFRISGSTTNTSIGVWGRIWT